MHWASSTEKSLLAIQLTEVPDAPLEATVQSGDHEVLEDQEPHGLRLHLTAEVADEGVHEKIPS